MDRTPSSRTPITVLDLFAGCGGLTEGFHQFRTEGAQQPSFRTVGAVEWDPAAAATFALNFGPTSERHQYFDPPEIFCRDIVGWEPSWRPGDVEVIVGGPPCQGFSGLNRGKVRAERNQLWQEYIRVVIALQPKVFVIENVDRFLRSPEFADLKQRVGNGDLHNYHLVKPIDAITGAAAGTEGYLLNSADFGAPQARRRAIVIGVRTDTSHTTNRMRYPEPTHAKNAESAEPASDSARVLRQPWLTADSIFEGSSGKPLVGTVLPDRRTPTKHLQLKTPDAELPGNPTAKRVKDSYPGPFLTSELHVTRTPDRLSLARYKAIPAEGNRKNLRSRYLCRFDDGTEMILEKREQRRDSDGQIVVFGQYVAVVDASPTNRTLTVTSNLVSQVSMTEPPGRTKTETFRVRLLDDGQEREAILEYLSTPAWDSHDTGAGDVMGRVRVGAPSVTIRTEFYKPEKGRYLHPTEDRPITHYEAAKLQGFPEEFVWCGSKVDVGVQIGNAVPIPLGTKIAQVIYTYLR